MNPMDYIKPEILILVPVMYLLGLMIKNTEYIKDKFIPLFLGIVSVILTTIYVLATSDILNYKDCMMAIFVAITQGILCAGCAVYINQNIKQSKKED